jgi:CheY-like chemotaxis protein
VADASQLLDTLMNLLLNSVEAMPHGGKITIDATERDVIRPNLKLNPEAKPGPYVVLRVRDTGVGMSREVMDLMFQPFFTTKRSRSAFGLGLTTAQSMVKGWGGWIMARSKEGGGATFRLFIPKAVEAAREAGGAAEGVSEGQAVLLVDRRAEFVSVMKEALGKAGYQVRTAQSAGEVSGHVEQAGSELDLVVVDAMMPDGEWHGVLSDMIRNGPCKSVLVTSGFCREYVRHHLPPGAWEYLQKPFTPDDLVGIVNAMVRGNDAAQTGIRPR